MAAEFHRGNASLVFLVRHVDAVRGEFDSTRCEGDREQERRTIAVPTEGSQQPHWRRLLRVADDLLGLVLEFGKRILREQPNSVVFSLLGCGRINPELLECSHSWGHIAPVRCVRAPYIAPESAALFEGHPARHQLRKNSALQERKPRQRLKQQQEICTFINDPPIVDNEGSRFTITRHRLGVPVRGA
ncbi:hypothetical protein BDW62DRAFT_191444 [Aspergillus aurantiobrunneus]